MQDVAGTWFGDSDLGNVSAIDREKGLVVIASGVPYEDLTAEQMVVVDLRVTVKGPCPHRICPPPELYRAFSQVGAVIHTHPMGYHLGPGG